MAPPLNIAFALVWQVTERANAYSVDWLQKDSALNGLTAYFWND